MAETFAEFAALVAEIDAETAAGVVPRNPTLARGPDAPPARWPRDAVAHFRYYRARGVAPERMFRDWIRERDDALAAFENARASDVFAIRPGDRAARERRGIRHAGGAEHDESGAVLSPDGLMYFVRDTPLRTVELARGAGADPVVRRYALEYAQADPNAPHARRLIRAAWTSDGRRVVVGNVRVAAAGGAAAVAGVAVVDARRGAVVAQWPVAPEFAPEHGVVPSPDDARVLVYAVDSRAGHPMVVYAAATGAELVRVPMLPTVIRRVPAPAWSSDGAMVALADRSEAGPTIVDAATGAVLFEGRRLRGEVRGVMFAPGAQRRLVVLSAASAASDWASLVSLWDFDTDVVVERPFQPRVIVIRADTATGELAVTTHAGVVHRLDPATLVQKDERVALGITNNAGQADRRWYASAGAVQLYQTYYGIMTAPSYDVERALVFQSAATGALGAGSTALVLVRSDGDHAIAHRILMFMLGTGV